MALPVSFYGVTVADNTVNPNGSPQTATWRVPIITLTPGNVAATATLAGNLLTAVQAICLGANQQTRLMYDEAFLSSTPAASKLAQRGVKWLVRYHDSVTEQKFTVSLPCADLTKLPDHEEFLDLTAGDGLAFKTAFEAVVVSPDNSANSIVVDTVQYVDRKA